MFSLWYPVRRLLVLSLLVVVAACVPLPETPAARLTAPPLAPAGASPCGLDPAVAPTMPAEIPGYTELDPATGLHVTGTPQEIDLDTYRLRVSGKVDRPLALTYEELRCLPKTVASPLLVCPGFFEDQATWAGTPIGEVLALAGVQGDAQTVAFVSADGYSSSMSLDRALDADNLLAYEWEGEPLPRLHGFPLRLVLPGVDGNQWTQWVVEVRVD